MGHLVGLVLNATRQWFIRFCATPNNLGVPVSSWGTLEYNRADLTVCRGSQEQVHLDVENELLEAMSVILSVSMMWLTD